MNTIKVTQNQAKGKSVCLSDFDHFLALDWSMKVMAIAHMRRRSKEPETFERPTDLKELKQYLATLKGRKVITIEETTTAQWLYVELIDHVVQHRVKKQYGISHSCLSQPPLRRN